MRSRGNEFLPCSATTRLSARPTAARRGVVPGGRRTGLRASGRDVAQLASARRSAPSGRSWPTSGAGDLVGGRPRDDRAGALHGGAVVQEEHGDVILAGELADLAPLADPAEGN